MDTEPKEIGPQGGTFDSSEIIIDEWETQTGDKYRLINFGAGPDVLQIWENDAQWALEKEHFKWGSITHRIRMLKNHE